MFEVPVSRKPAIIEGLHTQAPARKISMSVAKTIFLVLGLGVAGWGTWQRFRIHECDHLLGTEEASVEILKTKIDSHFERHRPGPDGSAPLGVNIPIPRSPEECARLQAKLKQTREHVRHATNRCEPAIGMSERMDWLTHDVSNTERDLHELCPPR